MEGEGGRSRGGPPLGPRYVITSGAQSPSVGFDIRRNGGHSAAHSLPRWTPFAINSFPHFDLNFFVVRPVLMKERALVRPEHEAILFFSLFFIYLVFCDDVVIREIRCDIFRAHNQLCQCCNYSLTLERNYLFARLGFCQ